MEGHEFLCPPFEEALTATDIRYQRRPCHPGHPPDSKLCHGLEQSTSVDDQQTLPDRSDKSNRRVRTKYRQGARQVVVQLR